MKAGRGGRRKAGEQREIRLEAAGCYLLLALVILVDPQKCKNMYSDSEIETMRVCSLNLDFSFPNDNTLSLCGCRHPQ